MPYEVTLGNIYTENAAFVTIGDYIIHSFT